MQRFDRGAYWALLDRLRATHRPRRFQDLGRGPVRGRCFLLRHDVDYSPAAALDLAREESDRGIRATYFLLPNGRHYNLLSAEHAGVPRALAALGHEVGLHYDTRVFASFPRRRWRALLETQAELLAELAGAPVRSIAQHQPLLSGPDPFRRVTRFVNAYASPRLRNLPYVSDACAAWRDASWAVLSAPRLPPAFQLVLHAENWPRRALPRLQLYARLHDDVARALGRERDALLVKIRAHQGVREHEARERRGRRARPARNAR